MKKYSVLIIIGGILVILVGVAILYLRPRQVFRRMFGCSLPESAIILDYNYQFLDDSLDCKISFNEADYSAIESGVTKYYEKYGLVEVSDEESLPYFNATCSWWDMNRDDVVLAYQAMMSGKRAKTKLSYSFIVRNSDGQYYLYIAS